MGITVYIHYMETEYKGTSKRGGEREYEGEKNIFIS